MATTQNLLRKELTSSSEGRQIDSKGFAMMQGVRSFSQMACPPYEVEAQKERADRGVVVWVQEKRVQFPGNRHEE